MMCVFYGEHLYISLAPATDNPQALQLAILNSPSFLLLLLFKVITHRTHLNLAIILIVMLLFQFFFFFLNFISEVFIYFSLCLLLLLLLSDLSSGTLSLKIVKNTYISAITLLFVVKCHFFLSIQICYLAQQAIFFFSCSVSSVWVKQNIHWFAVYVSYFQHPFFLPETHSLARTLDNAYRRTTVESDKRICKKWDTSIALCYLYIRNGTEHISTCVFLRLFCVSFPRESNSHSTNIKWNNLW